MTIRKPPIILFALCLLLAFSCKKWDNYNASQDSALNNNVLTAINNNADLSVFAGYLAKTGYDKIIASSKTFTVWAPNNAAMQLVDPTILSDTAKVKQFVGNHITTQQYFTADVKTFLYIKTLNGKNITFTKTTVDDQPIVKADQYAANGVIHIISSAIIPKPNALQYLLSTSLKQKTEMVSLNYTAFDKTIAVQTGIDPKTGLPIYKAGTGIVNLNRFTDLAPIGNEDSLYTYVILTDAAYNTEKANLAKFYASTSPTVSDSITNFNVIKSLSFKGLYNSDAFPDTVYSTVDSVKFKLKKSDIVETHRVSNGIVYVMNSISYKLYGQANDRFTKIKPIVIQGEKIDSMLSAKSPIIRTRRNPDSSLYKDIILENHGVSSFWFNYRTPANAVKYKVYWRVTRDYSLTLSGTATDLTYFPMSVAFGSQSAIAFTQPKPGVIDNGVSAPAGKRFTANYSEVYLGDYVSPSFYSGNKKDAGGLLNFLSIFLVGNNVTTNGANTLLLDYIKLVPTP
ncbi:fasciclin domain-containing protein [Mucilaginibacter sp. HMF5004]|uniref:fasciclin domain-containing protein n=1 Tax=Mucilaginibacter rivuli TaxID=2857527 RepID=UPI001C5D449B|nr:fasciclin domain-containing protein [Mucilaginibacter rivuli]MBW4888534.1 fasciclin domain-containing protein [Mucilaginibacter rivuli]